MASITYIKHYNVDLIKINYFSINKGKDEWRFYDNKIIDSLLTYD